MIKAAGLLLVCVSLVQAGYAYKSTVTFSGATGSTQTNITLGFSFNDPNFKTVANGGQIQNTVTRNGVTVPADFVISNSNACTADYSWGFDGDYSATAGTGHGWLLIPSYTTGGVTVTICFSNSAVNTYQGGAVGAEFDTNTQFVGHFPNGTSLSLLDFSSHANNGSNQNAVTANVGKIDGGGGFSNASNQAVTVASSTAFNASSFTVSCWFKTSTTGTVQNIMRRDDGAGNRSFLLRVLGNNTIQALAIYGGVGGPSTAGTYTDGNWHLAVATFSYSNPNTTITVYVDGVSQGTGSVSSANPSITTPLYIGGYSQGGEYFNGSLDEPHFSNTSRSSDWIATEYANQSNIPALSASVALCTAGSLSSLGAGVC